MSADEPGATLDAIAPAVQAALVVVASEQDPIWSGRFTGDVHRRVMDAARRAAADRAAAPTRARIPTAAEIVDGIELARDAPAPPGRDLTAQDVRDTLAGWEFVDDVDRQYAAEHLSRIARPSGGVGQPDTDEPPRFERGFYRLARDLDTGVVIVPAGVEIVVGDTQNPDGSYRVGFRETVAVISASAAALAAAGDLRDEHRMRHIAFADWPEAARTRPPVVGGDV